ncbi:hypothetical protein ACJ5XU_001714 [Providencia stuartii]
MAIIKKMVLFSLLISCTYSAHAIGIIKALSACDSRFFEEIKHNQEFAMIPQNITIAELFSQSGINIPLQYTTKDGLELTHFIAIAIDLERYKEISNNRIGGRFYYWGFETSMPEQDVIQHLSQHIPLIEGAGYFVANSKMRNAISEPWQKNLTPVSGLIPVGDSAEKLFFIEANKENNTVKIMCTLQGNVEEKDLQAVGLIH